MLDNSVPVVLIGRFTTFAGASTFATLPVNVVPYEKARIHLWRGKMPATSGFLLTLQESMDQDSWSTLISGDPGADTEMALDADLTMSWLRATVELTDSGGNHPSATCYAVGDLIARFTRSLSSDTAATRAPDGR